MSPREMDNSPGERAKWIAETLEVLRRAHPRNNPRAKDIVALHELHARHERSEGRVERAEAAEERAQHARDRDEHTFTNEVQAAAKQAGAELAFAKAMGWNDWTWNEETGEGMVRGYRVQWSLDSNAGLIVHDVDDEDTRYVLVTGQAPDFEIHGSTTVREAKATGRRIGEG